MTRYTDEALRSAPETVTESAYGLGATRFETARMTVRAALPGVIAGIIMGFARGIGDAATVLFTAGRSTQMPAGLFEPATTLPILIFDQSTSFNAEVRSHAYAASFVLIVAVLALIFLSKLLAGRFARYAPGEDTHEPTDRTSNGRPRRNVHRESQRRGAERRRRRVSGKPPDSDHRPSGCGSRRC